MLSMQDAWVQFLIREQGSYVPCVRPKKKKKVIDLKILFRAYQWGAGPKPLQF